MRIYGRPCVRPSLEEQLPNSVRLALLNVTRLIQLVENTTSLRYEGQPFNYYLFLTKQEKSLKNPLGGNYIALAKRIPYERALMSEQWIRAAVDGGEVGLVALGHGHGVAALFNVPRGEHVPKRSWASTGR